MAHRDRYVVLLITLLALFIFTCLIFSGLFLMSSSSSPSILSNEPEYSRVVLQTQSIPLIYDASNDPFPSNIYPEPRDSRDSSGPINLDDGLVLHLTFDENEGSNSFEDSSSNNNRATCSGDSCPVAGVSGRVNSGIWFDGNNDFLRVDDDSSYRSSRELSLALWVKWESNSAGNPPLLWKSQGDDCPDLPSCTNREYFFGIFNRTWLHMASAPQGASTQAAISARDDPLSAGTWHHVVGIIDSDDQVMRLYIDGELSAERTIDSLSAGIRDSDGDLIIGAIFGHTVDSFLRGSMDEVRIYDRILNEDEIAELADN